MVIMPILLAALAIALAGHASHAVRTGVMPMRVSSATRATRPRAFWAAVAIELALAAAAMAGAIAWRFG